GNPEYVTVNELFRTIAEVAGKRVRIRHVDGPVGVHSRNFSNARIASLGWRAQWPLRRGIEATYPWIASQVAAAEWKSRSGCRIGHPAWSGRGDRLSRNADTDLTPARRDLGPRAVRVQP